jgi:hypothetical protein
MKNFSGHTSKFNSSKDFPTEYTFATFKLEVILVRVGGGDFESFN